MGSTTVALVDRPEGVRAALAPVRRQVLERLRRPASATEVAADLGMSRQKANYHVRALEAAGLVELVEERPRRGCTERVMRARADSFVVDPALLAPGVGEPDPVAAQDRTASERLLAVATGTVRDVARMQALADERGERLLTFTIEAEVGFAHPADLERFADAVADAVRSTAESFHDPAGRRYRVLVGGHPAPSPSAEEPPPWTTTPSP